MNATYDELSEYISTLIMYLRAKDYGEMGEVVKHGTALIELQNKVKHWHLAQHILEWEVRDARNYLARQEVRFVEDEDGVVNIVDLDNYRPEGDDPDLDEWSS